MYAEGELIDGGTLAAEVKNADLGIGDTAAEAGLGVWLVLAVAVATSRTATHRTAIRKNEIGYSSKNDWYNNNNLIVSMLSMYQMKTIQGKMK